jgi:peptide deformylase
MPSSPNHARSAPDPDPASLAIEHYPTEVLRQKADEVDPTPDVVAVARRMIELMHEAPGIGLAAPQVGLSWRLFVADVPEDPDRNPPRSATESGDTPPTASPGPEIYINPVIEKAEGTPEAMEEGCLSLPDILGDVIRPTVVTMSWTDEHGRAAHPDRGGPPRPLLAARDGPPRGRAHPRPDDPAEPEPQQAQDPRARTRLLTPDAMPARPEP